jgi:hypothetical protein
MSKKIAIQALDALNKLLKYTRQLTEQRDDLLAVLEQVEWVSSEKWAERKCLWCMGYESQGHAPDCERQKAIARAKGASDA